MEIITENGEYFDLPADYYLELEFINPLLDDVGSQTAPGTLPYTAHNLQLLDFPDRMDRARKYTVKRNITLRQDTFVKKATQAVLKANRSEKIVSTFYFDEAIFYEKIKGIKLSELNFTVDPSFPQQGNPSVQGCMDFIFQVLAQNRTSDFHVFPVITRLEQYPNFFDLIDKPEILNLMIHSENVNPVRLRDWSDRRDMVDNAVITYPAGYGVTFFLKVSYILESIARELGYAVGTNVFKTHPELQHLVIVNNVADTIVRGFVDYRQLVPAITASDFISILKTKFGAFLIVEEEKKLLHIELCENVLTSAADMDLTELLTEQPRIEWTEPRQVKLSAGKTLPFSAPKTELYEDFVKTYGIPEKLQLLVGDLIANKAYFDSSTSSIVMYVPDKDAPGWQTNKLVRLSSSNFAYYTKDTITIEDHNSDDEQLAEVFLMEQLDKNPSTGAYDIEGYLSPIVSNRRNVNTTLFINNEGQDTDQSEMPTMFCFRVPAIAPNGRRRKTVGTPYSRSYEQEDWGNLSLTCQGEDGLYNKLWKTYDTCLRYSFHTVHCSMNIPFVKLQQLKLHTPKLLFNQPVLIERIKCKIGNGKCEITEAIFRTLRPYTD